MEFHFTSFVTAPLAETFRFHEDPANLEVLHHECRSLRLLHHEGGIQVGAMTWFEITVAHVVPVVLAFRHTQYEPPLRFGEEVVHGPFAHFVHRHEFTPRRRG